MRFGLESELEARMCADPEWRRGVEWDKPRSGHPESAVKDQIAEVLANVERYARDRDARRRLRLIALVHDSFKHQVDPGRPRSGENHHGTLARRFAERYLSDLAVLEVTELHDEAYNAHSMGARKRDWTKAEARARPLIQRLSPDLDRYITFFRCDNETGTKSPASYDWFVALAGSTERTPTGAGAAIG